MAIEVTADLEATTYATVTQADAEAELRRGAVLDAWSELDDDDKLAALISATRDVDTLDWIGDRASAEQELEWPRTDTDYSTDAWPRNLVRAVIELAFSYAPTFSADEPTDPLAPDPANGNIKKETIGPISTEFFAPTSTAEARTTIERFPAIVQNLLRPLIRAVSTSQWGQGRVVRAS